MSDKQFSVQRVFLKDSSFETPIGVQAFEKTAGADVNVDLSTRNQQLNEELVQVDLRVTVTSKAQEEALFVAEVEYAGLFSHQNIEESELKRLLGTVCPGILFPYIRETLDSLIVKGNFPALMLAPINFDALFNDAVELEKAKQSH